MRKVILLTVVTITKVIMRKVILLTVVLLTSVVANAQRLVSGKVVEQDTQEAVIQATASILSGEKIVANALTNMNGGFSIRAPRDGKYTLKITYVGFKTYTKQINIRDGKDYSAGTITMEPDAIMLKGATVTARASKVTLKADTFMYNASASPVLRSATTEPSRSTVRK